MDFHHLQLFLLNGELSNPKIGEIIQNCLNDARPIRPVHQKLHVGKLLLELGKNTGQNECRSLRWRQSPIRRAALFPVVDRVLSLPPQGEDLLRVLSEYPSGDCK